MTVRINQRLREGYNPDGTPGTVSTGTPGVPGRAPTSDEIAEAVAAYIDAHPPTVEAVTTSAREHNRFGAGATGAPGSYVDVGSHGTLNGYVVAGGTPQVVNLYLAAKGAVVLVGTAQVQGDLAVDGELVVRDNGGNAVNVWDELAGQLLAIAEIQAELPSKVTGTGITNIEKLTQAAYDALAVKDPETLYVIVD